MMEKSSLLQGGEPSDEELIEKIRKQDHDALSLLLNRYIPMIAAKARESRMGTSEMAESSAASSAPESESPSMPL